MCGVKSIIADNQFIQWVSLDNSNCNCFYIISCCSNSVSTQKFSILKTIRLQKQSWVVYLGTKILVVHLR